MRIAMVNEVWECYKDGFQVRYKIQGKKVVLARLERVSSSINFIRDETVLGEDWVKEHKGKYGIEVISRNRYHL